MSLSRFYVEITLMRDQITVVSVVITFVRVKITLRTEITPYVYELHSSLLNNIYCSEITLVRVFMRV
jgi:hypothetical protein